MTYQQCGRVIAILLPCAGLIGCGDDDGAVPIDATTAADAATQPGIDAAGPDGSASTDAGLDAGLPACVELDDPAVTLATYPATFAGSTDGAGNNMHVHDRICTVEPAELFDLPGPDQVVELTALAPGHEYVVRVRAPGDGPYFYVITGCDESVRGPGPGDCLLFDQVSFSDTEVDRFIAPDDGHAWVVLDSLYTAPAPPYEYVLQVYEPECEEGIDCPEGSILCAENRCHECLDDFDCADPGRPICDFEAGVACLASTAMCDGDDAAEDGDDGPAGATDLGAPAPGAPVTLTRAYCQVGDHAPAIEADYYRVTLAAGERRGFALAWDDPEASLSLVLLDPSHATIGTSFGSPGYVEARDLAAGTFLIRVEGFTAATTAYTLTSLVPECDDSFGCADPAAPSCTIHLCVAGPATCVADDAAEGDDDGPSGATLLAPTTAVPAVASAAICAVSGELDFYRITLPPERRLAVEVDWTGDAFVQLTLYDQLGNVVTGGGGHPARVFVHDVAPMDYFASVSLFATEDLTASLAYTLTASVPDCGDSFDCEDAATPICTFDGDCVAGPADCVDDDADGDDGPAAATALSPAAGGTATHDAAICGSPFGQEADFYVVTVADGDGLEVTLTADALASGRRLELAVLDPGGDRIGQSRWVEPEVVQVANLAAGTYYLVVTDASEGTTTASLDYTIEVARAAGGCATDADCATDYATQLYRAHCEPSGACVSIDGAGALAAGERCDSADDCASGACSYNDFAAGADASVCTVVCSTAEDCAALGDGSICTVALFPNVCRVPCVTDLDCGIDIYSSTPDPDLPWDYLTCDDAGVCSF